MTDSVLAHRVWVVLRFLICWLAAIALMIAGFIVPLIVVWRWVGNAVVDAWGLQHDLSDIAAVIVGFLAGGVAGVIAGSIGMTIASVPALALVGKSGVFNRFRRRHAEREQETWLPPSDDPEYDLLNSRWPDEPPRRKPDPHTDHGDEG